MHNISMEHKGSWWIPGSGRKKVIGTLNISESRGARLQLQGSLRGRGRHSSIFSQDLYSTPIVNGTTINGNKIALIDCTETRSSMQLKHSKVNESEFVAMVVVFDCNYRSVNSVRFDKLCIRFTELESWLDINQIHTVFPKGAPCKIEADEVFRKSFKVSRGIKIEIESSCYPETLEWPQTSATMIQRAQFAVSCEKKLRLSKYEETINSIRMLLCLANQRAIYTENIMGYSSRNVFSMADGKTHNTPMEIYIRRFARKDATDKARESNRLFSLMQIEEYMPHIIKSVVDEYSSYRPLFECYLPYYYLESSFLETRVLSMVAGLERYHRMKYGGNELPKSVHRMRIRNILGQLSETEHKAWLNDKLTWSNEYSLRRRLEELIEHHKNILVGLIKDKEDMIKIAANTRNYLMHGSNSSKQRARTPREMMELLNKMRILVDACLLAGIGVSDEKARELLTQYS